MTGVLTIKLVEAELTRDTEVLGQMDPYVVFTFNNVKSTSKILDSAGLNPVWNEQFEFKLLSTDEIQMDVFDKDTFSSDLIGSAKLKVSVLGNKGSTNMWVDIHYKKEVAGKIHLDSVWHADKVQKASQNEEAKEEADHWIKRTTFK